MGKAGAWISTFRLPTLLLALGAASLVGYLAVHAQQWHVPAWIAYTITILALQILSNVANDYGDLRHGADVHRIGPRRAIHKQQISVRDLRKGMNWWTGIALAAGSMAIVLSPTSWIIKGGLWAAGLASLWAARAYTATAQPYGYRGLGDLAVFVFFGPMAIGAGFWLVTGHFEAIHWIIGAAYGLLSTAVLNLNNLRDIPTDRVSGKHTLATRLGRQGTIIYHGMLLIGALLLHLWWGNYVYHSQRQYYALFYGVIFFYHWGFVARARTPQRLTFMLKQLVLTAFAYAHVIGLSLWVK